MRNDHQDALAAGLAVCEYAAHGKSADEIAKDMQESGMTEAALRDQVKKALAIQKLVDKITGKIE